MVLGDRRHLGDARHGRRAPTVRSTTCSSRWSRSPITPTRTCCPPSWAVALVGALTAIIPAMLALAVFAVVANVAQVGLPLTGKPLKPKMSRLNPVAGLKRMFSVRSLWATLTSALQARDHRGHLRGDGEGIRERPHVGAGALGQRLGERHRAPRPAAGTHRRVRRAARGRRRLRLPASPDGEGNQDEQARDQTGAPRVRRRPARQDAPASDPQRDVPQPDARGCRQRRRVDHQPDALRDRHPLRAVEGRATGDREGCRCHRRGDPRGRSPRRCAVRRGQAVGPSAVLGCAASARRSRQSSTRASRPFSPSSSVSAPRRLARVTRVGLDVPDTWTPSNGVLDVSRRTAAACWTESLTTAATTADATVGGT